MKISKQHLIKIIREELKLLSAENTTNQINYRDVTSYINERQNFDFKAKKKAIMRFASNVLKGREDLNIREHNPFYSIITGEPQVGDSVNIGLSPEFAASWKKYFVNEPFIREGPWGQINLGEQFKKATGDDRTLNFYVTVAKEKNNIIKFFQNYYKLEIALQQISLKYKTPIKFKTHCHLDYFVTHNDSLKVYYYDPQIKDLVTNATRKWLSDNDISTTSRTHEHGVDLKSRGGSFGMLISYHIYDIFTSLIKDNGEKYDEEEYYNWLVKYFTTLIKQVKPNENI